LDRKIILVKTVIFEGKQGEVNRGVKEIFFKKDLTY